MRNKSPEEMRGSAKVPRAAKSSEFDGGGFMEGTHGRGPTPYKRSLSHRNGAGMSMDKYEGTAGRGGGGIIGKGDDFKKHAADIEHPQSHSEFEQLGHAED